MISMETETKKFSAEIGKVLNLMIHSLYTNKDIFIRELISNASDACDRLRLLSYSKPELMKKKFKIIFKVDKDKRLLTISDNGIGMNKQDLIENLGTIAHSGTQHFLSQITGDTKKDNLLIGQFGVGFYSVYMSSSIVSVISKKVEETQAYCWTSDGQGEYTISETDSDLANGTIINLTIKESEDVYLDHFRIKNIIKTYSDHIAIPIFFTDPNGKEIQVNSFSAIWTRNKSDITPQQYEEFYRSVSYSADKPWLILHNKNEGAVEFTNLLFIPTSKTFDLYNPDRKRRVKLYIKRVFITDENVELIPQFLRFLRGIVDSEDLPLNISRETLQYNPIMEKIRTSISKRILNELKKKKDENIEQYQEFWSTFGPVLKEGLCEGLSDPDPLLSVCIFYSAKLAKFISFDEYINNFQQGQDVIYYLSGEDIDKLKQSPQIEGFLNKNIDVLLFIDTVDDFWVNVILNIKIIN